MSRSQVREKHRPSKGAAAKRSQRLLRLLKSLPRWSWPVPTSPHQAYRWASAWLASLFDSLAPVLNQTRKNSKLRLFDQPLQFEQLETKVLLSVDLIYSPTEVIDNPMGARIHSGPDRMINQSGINSFTSGVTAFDSYMQGDVTHVHAGQQFYAWYSNTPTGTIDLDLGDTLIISRMAFWPSSQGGPSDMTIYTASNPDFTDAVNVGTFFPEPPSGVWESTEPFVFDLVDSTNRYVRFQINESYYYNGVSTIISEIAFAAKPIVSVFVNQTSVLEVPVGTDFEDVAGGSGTHYDGVLASGRAAFAERFAGQTLSPTNENPEYDALTGVPSEPLSLVAGDPGQNLSVTNYGFAVVDNVISGVGTQGFPNADAIGEGSVAVHFPFPQTEFGFNILDAWAGTIEISLYGVDGSLIESFSSGTSGLHTIEFQSNAPAIAGFTIENVDPGGISFDNFRYATGISLESFSNAGPNNIDQIGLTYDMGGFGAIQATVDVAIYADNDELFRFNLNEQSIQSNSFLVGLLNENGDAEAASELLTIGQHTLLIDPNNTALKAALEDQSIETLRAVIDPENRVPFLIDGSGMADFRGFYQSSAGNRAVVRTGSGAADTVSVAADGTVSFGALSTVLASPSEILVMTGDLNDEIIVDPSAGPVVTPLIILAGADDDIIETAGGNDIADGGLGNDRYRLTANAGGMNVIIDPDGTDTLDFSEFPNEVLVDLSLTTEQAFPSLPGFSLTLSGAEIIEDVDGSTQADMIRGNALANTINGLAGNDELFAGPQDIVLGGLDDDVIHLTDLSFQQVDGGDGSDTLIFDGAGDLLLSVIDASQVQDIEIIDLTAGSVDSLVVGQQDVVNLTDSNNTILVKRVDKPVLLEGDWNYVGNEDIDSLHYLVMSSGLATLKLQTPDIQGLSFNIADVSVDEGTDIVFEAQLQSAAATELTIPLFVQNPIVSADYSFAETTITIAAGELTGSTTITTFDDALDEYDEQFYFATLDGRHTVTILDNDPPPKVSFTSLGQRVSEDIGQYTISAKLSEVSGRDVFVPVAFSGTANLGDDYTLPDGSVILIDEGSLIGSIAIIINDDNLGERSESIIAEMQPSNQAELSGLPGDPLTQSIIIDVSDTPTVYFDTVGREVSEVVGDVVVTVKLSNPSAETIIVPLPASLESTANENDYNYGQADLVFTPGETELDVILSVINDDTPATIIPTSISMTQQVGALDPLDGVQVDESSTPTLGDLDGDGDLDLISGNAAGEFEYFENIGSVMAPQFVARRGLLNPLDGFDVGDFSSPTLVDLDGDGVLDLVAGTDAGMFEYFENTGTTTLPAFTQRSGNANPMNQLTRFDGFFTNRNPSAAFSDVDNDGDLDLLVGKNGYDLPQYWHTNRFVFYENTGSSTTPIFSYANLFGDWANRISSFDTVVAPTYAKPTFGDVDHDGDFDIVVGRKTGGFRFIENIGSPTTPEYVENFGSANPLSGQLVGTFSAPTFGDLNGDGVVDLVVGNEEGEFSFFVTDLGTFQGPFEEVLRESVVLDLQPAQDVLLGETPRFVLEIIDDDVPIISLDAIDTLWEDAGTITVTATLTRSTTQNVTVPVFLARSGVSTDPLTDDIVLNVGVISIDGGIGLRQGSTTITVEDDLDNEDTEGFILQMGRPTNALQGDFEVSFDVLDNDPIIRFETVGSTVEGSSPVVRAFLEGDNNRAINVSYVVSPGSATEGDDYNVDGSSSGVVEIPPFKSSWDLVTIDLVADSLVEFRREEFLNIEFTAPGYRIRWANTSQILDLGQSVNHFVSVFDNDRFGAAIEFAKSGTNVVGVKENSGSTGLTIRLNKPADSPVTLVILGYDNSSATINEDLSFSKSELFFPAGADTDTVTIFLNEDTAREGPETFRFSLSQLGSNVALDIGKLNILDTTILYDTAVIDLDLDADDLDLDNLDPGLGGEDIQNFVGVNKYFSGGLAFFDGNNNGVRDFLDSNNNGIQDVGEPTEPSATTDLDGLFRLAIPEEFDIDQNGLINELDGQIVLTGGIDTSTGLPLDLSLTAPAGFFAVTPVTTLINQLIRNNGFSAAAAQQRILEALGIAQTELSHLNPIASHLDGNRVASELLVGGAMIHDTVVQIAKMVSSTADSPQYEFVANQVFEDMAAKLSQTGSVLNLRLPAVIESIIEGTLYRTATDLDPEIIRVSASVIAAGKQYIDSLNITDSVAFLWNLSKAQLVSQGDVASALSSVADGTQQIATIEAQYTGKNLQREIAAAEVKDVLPPILIISNASTFETEGNTTLEFTVSLLRGSVSPVSVDFTTADHLARVANSDYVATSGTLTWDPGDVSDRIIQVTVTGDSDFEIDEKLLVVLSRATNAVIRKDIGYGTILNDDAFTYTAPTDSDTNETKLLLFNGDLRLSNNGSIVLDELSSGIIPVTIIGSPDTTNHFEIFFDGRTDMSQIVLVGGSSVDTLTIYDASGTGIDTTVIDLGTDTIVFDSLSPSIIGVPTDPYEGALISLESELQGQASGQINYSWQAIYDNQVVATGAESEFSFIPINEGQYAVTLEVSTPGRDPESTSTNFVVNNLVDLTGYVFDDLNNDGIFDPDGADDDPLTTTDNEYGIAGVRMQLWDDAMTTLLAEQVTGSDGAYAFDSNLLAGNYRIVQVFDDPVTPEVEDGLSVLGLLDGIETAGTIGGSVNNSANNNSIFGISVGEPGTTPDGFGYNFGEIRPSSLQGIVFEDFDNDGLVDMNELALGGVAINLNGTDDRGNAVSLSQTTNSDGIFEFVNLRPGQYEIQQVQPGTLTIGNETVTLMDAQDILGAVNGAIEGQLLVNDTFSNVNLVLPASHGVNYNFAERIDGGQQPDGGVTATIGFWQNKNGKDLILGLNGDNTGGQSSTLLGDWLAATFPNIYGATAHNLGGMTNLQVYETYRSIFKRHRQASPGGPPKLDAQVMAVALATYVTRSNLASQLHAGASATAQDAIDHVTSYGFTVSVGGLGSTTVNVGDNGAAFGVADGSEVSIMDLLLAVNDRSEGGLLFDGNGDGDIDSTELDYRRMANDLFSMINENGDI